MGSSAAERKRAQRAKSAAGAVSAEAVRKKLLAEVRNKVGFWCLDTTRPEPTAMDVIHAVAECYKIEDRARVLAYLGVPTDNPDADV